MIFFMKLIITPGMRKYFNVIKYYKRSFEIIIVCVKFIRIKS